MLYGQLTIPFLRDAALCPHLDPPLATSPNFFKLFFFFLEHAEPNPCRSQRAGFSSRFLKSITLGFRSTCSCNVHNQNAMAMWLLYSTELRFAADVYECMGAVRKFAAQSPFCTEGFEEKPRHQTYFRICKSCFGVFSTPD